MTETVPENKMKLDMYIKQFRSYEIMEMTLNIKN